MFLFGSALSHGFVVAFRQYAHLGGRRISVSFCSCLSTASTLFDIVVRKSRHTDNPLRASRKTFECPSAIRQLTESCEKEESLFRGNAPVSVSYGIEGPLNTRPKDCALLSPTGGKGILYAIENANQAG